MSVQTLLTRSVQDPAAVAVASALTHCLPPPSRARRLTDAPALCSPHSAGTYPDHLDVKGNNGITMNDVANCWVSNVRAASQALGALCVFSLLAVLLASPFQHS